MSKRGFQCTLNRQFNFFLDILQLLFYVVLVFSLNKLKLRQNNCSIFAEDVFLLLIIDLYLTSLI